MLTSASPHNVPLAASSTIRVQTASGDGRKIGLTSPDAVDAHHAMPSTTKIAVAIAAYGARPIRCPIRSRARRRLSTLRNQFAAARKSGSSISAAVTSLLTSPAFFAAFSTSMNVRVRKSPLKLVWFSLTL